jgi:uncharacterized protein YdhG (YjbR/CyaY superfamily)
MRQRAEEQKAAARRGPGASKEEGENDVLAKIAEMQEPDRVMAGRLHAVIKATAADLSPRTWYGMPAYAKHGSVLCFFKSAQKFKTRYATLGFGDKANLDEGSMWPTERGGSNSAPGAPTVPERPNARKLGSAGLRVPHR